MTIPEQAVQAAKDVLYYANPNDVERALAVVKEYLTTRALSSPDYADADHAQARDVLARFHDYVIEGITAGTIMRGGEHHNPIWQEVASVLHADAGKVEGDGWLPQDATDEMVEAALAVDWDNEDERATVHNIWHALRAKLPFAPSEDAE